MKKENKKTKLNLFPDVDKVYPLVSLRTEPYEFQFTNPICRWNKKTKNYEPIENTNKKFYQERSREQLIEELCQLNQLLLDCLKIIKKIKKVVSKLG